MPYVRLSLLKPLRGEEQRLDNLQLDLLRFLSGQPGFIDGYVLRSNDGSGEVGRLGVWESEAFADQAANSEHVLALRSEINRLVTDSHSERSFQAE